LAKAFKKQLTKVDRCCMSIIKEFKKESISSKEKNSDIYLYKKQNKLFYFAAIFKKKILIT
jgi:hypothetical protein